MRLLLDTHALIWFAADAAQLSAAARTALEDPRNTLFASIASFWELAIKQSLGKIEVDLDGLMQRCDKEEISLLAISLAHAKRIGRLPHHHRDPFDRMLVAQALEESLELVSADARLDAYGVRRLW